jgi:hypothetical protein
MNFFELKMCMNMFILKEADVRDSVNQGCQTLLGTIYQNGGKYTK